VLRLWLSKDAAMRRAFRFVRDVVLLSLLVTFIMTIMLLMGWAASQP